MIQRIQKGDMLRKKKIGAPDEVLTVEAVYCSGYRHIKVIGNGLVAWEMPFPLSKEWQHIPCGPREEEKP